MSISAALKDAGDQWLMIGAESWNTVKQREHMQQQKVSPTEISDETKLVHDYPEFKQSDYYGLAGEITALATANSEADPVAVYFSFLTAMAAMIGANKFIRVGDSIHNPRIYCALVGNSSRARKGTSFKPVERIIRKTEEVAVKRGYKSSCLAINSGGLSSAEGLIFAVRDEADECKRGGEPLWDGVDDKRLLVVEEEFAGVLKIAQREGNTLSPIIRRAWDGGHLAPMTKNNKLSATGAHINMLAHITHFELKMMFSQNDQRNGLGNRFLWVCVRRPKKVPLPQPMDDDAVYQLAIKLSVVLKSAGVEKEVTFSDKALALWTDIYHDISTDDAGLKAILTARSEAYIIRLSLLFALLDDVLIVETCHLNAAVSIIEYCGKSVEYLFTKLAEDASGDSQKLLDALSIKPLTQSEVSKVFSGHKTKNELKIILDELQTMKKIKQSKEKSSKKIIWEKI